MDDIDENVGFDDENEVEVDQVVDANNEENEMETATRVEPTKKRIVRNPLPKLNADRLRGPRGLIALRNICKDIRFAGKGHEKDNLDTVMGRLEQWTHRLFPKFTFDDALNRIETLGHKSQVSNYVKRIRLDLEDEDQRERLDENVEEVQQNSTDLFDTILDQTIALNPNESPERVGQSTLTDEQRERMIRNRLLAEERRINRERQKAGKIKNFDNQSQLTQSSEIQEEVATVSSCSVVENSEFSNL